MSNDKKETWHSRWMLKREQRNQKQGRSGEDIQDQWVSGRINRYNRDAPEDAPNNLRAVYERKGKIINYNCLDAFNVNKDPTSRKIKVFLQQPHESLDKIYILERANSLNEVPERYRPTRNIFRQCWPGSRTVREEPPIFGFNTDTYVMRSINSIATHIPNHHYFYVIYSDIPNVVMCCAHDPKRLELGHTSIVKGRIFWYRHDKSPPFPDDQNIDYTKYSVLVAGELFFENGKLLRWNNRSGHYRPRKAPVVEFGATDHILPRKRFFPTETS
ncbi:MAG: hypothetical protein LBI71_07200 [Enterobacteriaceae bacterium]|nr:hypothetical protein [Enterobacteriaceae bacterium]